ncbi:histidine kinase N-terminal 7TM domain-containing protein [Haloarchaeobius baliensis]|uniref:histidine kinase N-terminal 7TM domain-containing protein n=1 Tax=Haloarchaeobius baliensis TaxID=1670458 RepID=UPI003F88595F
MALAETIYNASLVLSILVSLVALFIAWQYSDRRESNAIVALVVGSIAWASCSLWYAVATTDATRILASKAAYFGITLTVAAWVVFALLYTGREHLAKPSTYALLAVEPVIALALVWTGYRNLWWRDIIREPAEAGLAIKMTSGPAFVAHSVYSYGLMLAAAFLVLRHVYRSHSIYQRQAAAMLVAIITPLVGNALFITGLVETGGLDLTPITFAVSGIAITVGITRFGLTDVAPVARDTVLDNISDGVFVLDDSNAIVEINPEGKRLLGVEGQQVVGSAIEEVLDAEDPLYRRYSDIDEAQEEIAVDTDEGRRWFDVDVDQLESDEGEDVGRLFLVRDVTERKRREQELERQKEQLERFTTIVSQDLDEPLDVAERSVNQALKTGKGTHLKTTRQALRSMDAIVDDMVTLAQQGELITDDEMEFYPVADVAEEAWANVPTADATLDVQTNRFVRADRSRLVRLFENLYVNAVEHGGPDVTVAVGLLSAADGSAVADPAERGFYVSDSGTGIPQDQRGRVLEAGYASDDDGTGLGLAIVDSIADAHGWDVHVTDGGDGGARFEFTGAVVD